MPETKTGTCPWCERQNKLLFSTSGWFEEGHRIVLWTEYVCADCRLSFRRSEETETIE